MVQEVTGVKVLSMHHDISTATGEEVVLFSLSEPPGLREVRSDKQGLLFQQPPLFDFAQLEDATSLAVQEGIDANRQMRLRLRGETGFQITQSAQCASFRELLDPEARGG